MVCFICWFVFQFQGYKMADVEELKGKVAKLEGELAKLAIPKSET